MGVQLFVRSYPTIALSQAGRALHERVSDIIQEVYDLEPVMQEFRGLARGTLEIGATATASGHILPQKIAAFHHANPGIVLHLQVGNTHQVIEWLTLNEVEIAVCGQPVSTREYTSRPFYRDPLVVLCRADAEIGDTISVEELASLPKVTREVGSSAGAQMEALLADIPGGNDFVARVNGTTSINETVAAGVGVTVAALRSAGPWIEQGSVRQVRILDVEPYVTFYVVYPKRRYLSPAARAFLALLNEQELEAGVPEGDRRVG